MGGVNYNGIALGERHLTRPFSMISANALQSASAGRHYRLGEPGAEVRRLVGTNKADAWGATFIYLYRHRANEFRRVSKWRLATLDIAMLMREISTSARFDIFTAPMSASYRIV